MSDEEREALDKLKTLIKYLIVWKENFTIVPEDVKYLITVINLIVKQQKENEEIRDWKYVIDTIEDLDKLKELDFIKIKGKKFINEDKIRAKIEEVKDGTYDAKIVLESLLESR